jgi:hypothetical protein
MADTPSVDDLKALVSSNKKIASTQSTISSLLQVFARSLLPLMKKRRKKLMLSASFFTLRTSAKDIFDLASTLKDSPGYL